MRYSRIALAALAAVFLTTSAEARLSRVAPLGPVTQFCGDRPCPTFQTGASPHFRTVSAASRAHRQRAAASRPARPGRQARQALPGPSLGERTLGGYAIAPETMPPDQATRFGLVTIDVAGGHRITVSPDFGAQVAPLIADLYAHGYKFTRIKCAASRGQGHHVRKSNHWTGDACDFFGMHPPADLVRAHGLRSGRDFADGMHVDNARNVGGVDFWNSVRHRHYAGHHRRSLRLAGR